MGSFFLANCSTQDRSLLHHGFLPLLAGDRGVPAGPAHNCVPAEHAQWRCGHKPDGRQPRVHPGACHEPRAGGPGRWPSLPHGPDTASCGEEALHQGACCQQCPLAPFHPVLISNPKSHVDSSICTCHLGTRTAHSLQYDGRSPGKSGLLTRLLTCRGR